MQRTPIADTELHAYIDGELTAERRNALAAVLARDSALAARLAAFQADKDRLAAAFGPLADRALPPEWIARIDSHAAERPPSLARHWRLAAAAAVLAALIGGGVMALRPPHDTILAEAQAAQQGTLHPRLALTGAALPAAPNTVIQAALAMKIRAPDLTRFGYRLTAVDVFAKPAVGLVYVDAQARNLTIYVRKSSGQPRFDLLRRGKLRVCIWQDEVVGAVMTGDMSAGEMMRVASASYVDLNM